MRAMTGLLTAFTRLRISCSNIQSNSSAESLIDGGEGSFEIPMNVPVERFERRNVYGANRVRQSSGFGFKGELREHGQKRGERLPAARRSQDERILSGERMLQGLPLNAGELLEL